LNGAPCIIWRAKFPEDPKVNFACVLVSLRKDVAMSVIGYDIFEATATSKLSAARLVLLNRHSRIRLVNFRIWDIVIIRLY